MNNPLNARTARFVRFAYVLSVCIVVIEWASLVYYGAAAPPAVRVVTTTISLVPIWTLLVSVYLAGSEGLGLAQFFSRIGLSASAAFFMLPVLLLHHGLIPEEFTKHYQVPLIAKGVPLGGLLISIYVLYQSLIRLDREEIEPPKTATSGMGAILDWLKFSLVYFKWVAWDSWHQIIEINEREIAPEIKDRIHRQYEDSYSNREEIDAFQSTLTCPNVDAFFLAKRLTSRCNKQLNFKKIKIVDVGGGDGVFTANLLSAIDQRGAEGDSTGEFRSRIESVLCVDPAGYGGDYVSTLREVIPEARIDVAPVQVERHAWSETCDMLIAAHSLYAILERASNKGDGDKWSAVEGLLGHVENDGIVVITLGSDQGLSYRYRRDALRLIRGPDEAKPAIEDFRAFASRHQMQEVVYDNLIFVDRLLPESNSGTEDMFCKWLSYFLRVDATSLPLSYREELLRMLRGTAIKFGELSGSEIDFYRNKVDPNLHGDHWVLPHKVACFIRCGQRS